MNEKEKYYMDKTIIYLTSLCLKISDLINSFQLIWVYKVAITSVRLGCLLSTLEEDNPTKNDMLSNDFYSASVGQIRLVLCCIIGLRIG